MTRAASLSVTVAIGMGVVAALADRPLAEAFAAEAAGRDRAERFSRAQSP
jgi:hypothetical protein